MTVRGTAKCYARGQTRTTPVNQQKEESQNQAEVTVKRPVHSRRMRQEDGSDGTAQKAECYRTRGHRDGPEENQR